MVKFKFFVGTPNGGYYNTHYAKNAERAATKVEHWNEDFKGTNYYVELVEVTECEEKNPPDGYMLW